ncbi:MAG: hypothetical protein ICV83_24350, partial [Cytophagales bacterium]|nr:hypothetical protein [Cytophagales bacterium]
MNAIARSGNAICIGGRFTYVGPNTGSGVGISTGSGRVTSAPLLKINNTIEAAVSDGAGGWYIGGTFTQVHGTPRSMIAHILADGTLDQAWNPGADSDVRALAVAGNVVYIGGSFTRISGQTRLRVAALDARTGQLLAWNPGSFAEVYALAVAGNVVYAGGFFSNIGGQARNQLAAIDATTGQVTDWSPALEPYLGARSVRALAVAGNVVYVGGTFTSLQGKYTANLAAFDAITGRATDWSPPATDKSVNALAVAGNTVYIGGEFGMMGNETRRYLAAVDAVTGQLTDWNPGADFWVRTLAVAGNVVYAGGFFSAVGGQARKYLAAVDATTGQVTDWNPSANSWVNTVVVHNDVVYAGGGFSSVGGQLRNHIAVINATTGRLTDWNAGSVVIDQGGGVNALAFAGNTIYAGGRFFRVNNQPRNNAAAFDASTGQLTAWDPDVDNIVYALVVAENKIYLGGLFNRVKSQIRNYLAAVDANTGQLTPWQPDANSTVNALAFVGNTLYVGGEFTAIGGQVRNRLAAVDALTGQLSPWNPDVNSRVLAMSTSASTLYIGGAFTRVGGQVRNRLAALNIATGLLTGWNPDVTDNVNALAFAGKIIYAGGDFLTLNGQVRNYLVALDAATGELTPWQPKVNNSVNALTLADNILYAGGFFRSTHSSSGSYFAAFGRSGLQANYVRGSVYQDTNGDCVRNDGEKGMANVVIAAQPGNYFASTDSLGNYSLAVDAGSYAIEQLIPASKSRFIRQACPANPTTHTVRFTGLNATLAGKDFANQVTVRPHLDVSVSSTRRRRCFTSSTTVSYCNNGTGVAENVKVYVQLPEHVRLVGASAPYAVDKDQHYVFTIGRLEADQCGSIQLTDSVVCNNPEIRGLTQCTRAWITPSNATVPSGDWDKSDIVLKAVCGNNGRVRLGIYNVGEGSMADSSAFR